MKIPIWSPVSLVLLAVAACAPTTEPSTLNPDPVRGGPCHNGDQGCTPCPGKDYGCWEGMICIPRGCASDENAIGPDRVGNDFAAKKRDAGAEGGGR